jgi:PAS domain S-box-containing protein
MSMLFFVLALSMQTILVLWDVIDAPIVASLFFLGIIAAMGAELSNDMIRSARLANDLQIRENELRRERELTDAIFESAPGMLYLHSRDGRIVRWNSQHEKITGYANEETKEMRVESLFKEEDLPKLEEAWDRAFSKGANEIELDLIRKDGQAVRYFFTAVRVEIYGKPHLVGIGIDVSTQRAISREAAKQREEVAHLARMASMSELSSSLAHELNQPLAIILSNAQAAQRLLSSETPDLKEVRDILDDIVTADIRAADVIKRLRAILRRGEPVLEPVAPAELFTKALQLTKAEVESAHVIVNQRHSQKLPVIPADRIPVEQVLVNLIKNACDAMANNGSRDKTITLSCINEGASLRFSIRDNGCGLPENLDQIFEAFHSTKPNGLGLGLTICQTIIRAHGGRLWVEPNKSHGATFHFTLPY